MKAALTSLAGGIAFAAYAMALVWGFTLLEWSIPS